MATPKPPKAPTPAPPPAEPVDVESASQAEASLLKSRKGKSSSFLTKGMEKLGTKNTGL